MWRLRHATTPESRGRALPLAGWAVLLAALLASVPVGAAPVTAVGGFDHYAGPLGQTTNGVVGAVVLGVGGGDATIAGVRFDDSFIGQGYSVTGGAGAPLVPAVLLRVSGTRFIGDRSFRAWRAKVGPQFALPGGRVVTLSYAHYRDDAGVRSNGAIAEAATPIVAGLSGRVTTSYATAPLGPPAVQGSLGLGWNVVRHLELSGEVGLSRNAAGAGAQPIPSRGPLDDLPLLGGGGSGSNDGPAMAREVDGTVLLGLRVTLP